MTPEHVHGSPPRLVVVTCSVIVTAGSVFAAEPPKPTPRPGTLGAYAETIRLNRHLLADCEDGVVLTNDRVSTLAEGGAVILGTVTVDARSLGSAAKLADSAERARWRAAHRRQRLVIAKLERRRSQLEIEIDHLGIQRLTIKTMARLQQAEAKLRQLDDDIALERDALARIVRDARRRGAEPGWFR